MKRLIMSLVLMSAGLAGCGGYQVVTHTNNIFGDDNTIYACGDMETTLTRPKEFPIAIKGNVPLQGGTVNDSGDNSATLDKTP